jgi:acyl-CoA reductase-like NAD-dependent aldehyde dehydrogenase
MPDPERKYITSFDPTTSLHIGTFVADNEIDIANKIDRAAHVQQNWRKTTFGKRKRVIRSLLKWLVDNQNVAARVACRDTGKTCERELSRPLRSISDFVFFSD